ncbi:MAG: flagellar hook-length control protein FliK [Oscillospiraceae bacterium]
MDISSILSFGTDIITPDMNVFAEGDTSSEISFGDILGSAVNANTDVTDVQTEDAVLDEVPAQDSGKTFAELVSELKEDVSKADGNVIDAAIKLMLSVGNAAEKFLYGSSDGGTVLDEGAEKNDVISILSNMITLVTSETEEDFVSDDESGLALTLGDVSAVLETGLAEGKTADELADELKKLAESDDTDLAALADAVVSMMSVISGAELGDVNEQSTEKVTFEAAAKTAAVTEILSEDSTPLVKAETITSILENKADFNDLPSFESFTDALKLALYSEKTEDTAESGMDNSFNMIRKTAAFARINDVSAQVRVITGSAENNAVQNVGLAVQTPVRTDVFDETEIPSDPVQVYKELAEFTVNQITESVVSTAQNDAVKELVVVLKPENLGEVAVKLTSDTSGAVSVVLAASNEEVGRAIAANSSVLAESFAKQNINVESVNVVAPSEAASYMGLDFTNQGFNRRNNDAPRSENRGSSRITGIGAAEADEVQVSAAKNLLKEAKLWLTA